VGKRHVNLYVLFIDLVMGKHQHIIVISKDQNYSNIKELLMKKINMARLFNLIKRIEALEMLLQFSTFWYM
jgi:hypothetical protein